MATVEGTIVGYILIERDADGTDPSVDGLSWTFQDDAETERAGYQMVADKSQTGKRYSVGAIVELAPDAPAADQAAIEQHADAYARTTISPAFADALLGGEG